MRDLSKRLRGSDFRKAVKALAELRHVDRGEAARHIPAVHAEDPQRAFQIRVAGLIAAGGVHAVAAAWPELALPEWREQLVSEIGQAMPEWKDEGTLELFVTALEDPESIVSRRAVGPLHAIVKPRAAKERKAAEKTQTGRAFMAAQERASQWMTAARRVRIVRALTAALQRHADNPGALFWPDRFIELLGATATADDEDALAALEALRPKAGKPHRTEFAKLDRDNLPWPTSILADRKGIPPGTPMASLTLIPTGLLDLENLDRAIDQIRRRR